VSSTDTVRASTTDPNRDALGAGLRTRQHFVHCAVKSLGHAALQEIAKRAQEIATQAGYEFNDKTFSPQSTRTALVEMRGKEFVRQSDDGTWTLTDLAQEVIDSPEKDGRQSLSSYRKPEIGSKRLMTIDDKGRVLISGFNGALVEVEYVSENEVRIRKVRIVPI
jgi:hypothetical protein